MQCSLFTEDKAKLEVLTSWKGQDWELNLNGFRENEAGTCCPDQFVREGEVYSEVKAWLQAGGFVLESD